MPKLPDFIRGVYVDIADSTACVIDDNNACVNSASQNYTPDLNYKFLSQFNVVWLTFLDYDMKVPPSFKQIKPKLTDTIVLYAIGGQAYSDKANIPPTWMTDENEGEQMAANVLNNNNDYGSDYCDGIDLDLETPIMNKKLPGLLSFIRYIRSKKPQWIVTCAVMGSAGNYLYSKDGSEIYNIIAKTFPLSSNCTSENLIDTIGLMQYQGVTSLDYVMDWSGNSVSHKSCVNVPSNRIIAGLGGQDVTQDYINKICDSKDVGGFMLWCFGAPNGPNYGGDLIKRQNYRQLNFNCKTSKDNGGNSSKDNGGNSSKDNGGNKFYVWFILFLLFFIVGILCILFLNL